MRFNDKELAFWASSFEPDREGMMDKKGANKGQGYKQRWFRLKGNLLFYYKLDEFGGWQATDPLGVIVLERCHPDRIQHDSRPYSFMLSFEGDDTRTYFFSAYSQDDLKGWIKAIKMASYEGLRSTLYQLQSQLMAMTGEDPLKDKGVSIIAPQFSPHKEIARSPDVRRTILPRGSYKFNTRKKLSTQLTVCDSQPQFELSLSCGNLPSVEGGKSPTTVVQVKSYAKPTDMHPLATLFKTEVIESSCNPSYSHLLLLELGLRCPPSALLEFEVYSIDYSQSEDTCHLVSSSQDDGDEAVVGMLIGRAECLVSAVTASSADGKQLKLPLSDRKRRSLVCGFLYMTVTKVEEQLSVSPLVLRRNAINPPDSKSPIGLLPTIMFHPIRCHFSFPASLQEKKVKLKVFEEMTECIFNIQVPIELLKCYIKEDSVLLEELRTIGALDDMWGELLLQYQMMLYESIGYYGNAIKEMEDLGDTCGFKSSMQKRDRELEFIPTNLHIQRMRVQTEGKGETSYSFVTCGCHADHIESFKNGGLKKLLSSCRSCPSFISKFTEGKAATVKNYIARLRSIQESIQSCTNTLYRACANASPHDMNDAMIGVSKQIQQLFSLMESSTVKGAIDGLIQARPGSSSASSLAGSSPPSGGGANKGQDQPAVKRAVTKRRSHYIPNPSVGWKCNCGKCTKCLPSPSDWVWNGKSFVQVSKEWKMHDSADSIQQVLVTLIDNVETATRKVVDQRHEAVASEVGLGISTFKPTYVWSLELIPLFARLNQSLDGLFRITLSSLSFAIVQMDSHVTGLKTLKRRRDVVFSQALTTLATSFYMMLSKNFENTDFLRQIKSVGFLVQFESLLSSAGDESGMLEDMCVVVSELASVSFQMAELRRDLKDDDDAMFDFHIFGTRDALTIQLLIPCELLAKLPDEDLRQGEPIKVVPVLFTQGVNEKQTFANIKNDLPLLASSVQLQEEVNSQSIEVLSDYVERFQKFMESGGSNSRLRAVRTKDLLNLLKQSYASQRSKNVEFLITVEQLVHWLRGGRLTSCKSGKDRTSMSVTLEECSLLRTMHHLDNKAFNTTLSTLRSRGTRLENCHKNTGHRCYHFNQIQLMLLPKLLTPPPFTCRDPE